MTRQRLLILSFSNISTDARVLKQVKYFADRYDVTTYGYGPRPDSRVHHLQLDDTHGIRRWKRRDLILRRYKRMYWGQAAVGQATIDLEGLERFDVILANDIDTLGLALRLAPVRGVHADVHEYAPRQNEELLVWRVFEAPYMRWVCSRFLHRAASMTTVGHGIADEYRRVYGVRSGVVTNAAPYAELTAGPVSPPIKLVHSGASIRNRRLELLIDAVASTKTEVSLDFYLMGNDPNYVDMLRKRAAASDRIRFNDPIPYRDLIAKLNSYDVGVHVIAPTNFNNRWALPNKFFDYVQARLGIIIGPSAEMQSILKAHGCGAVADDFGAEALTDVLDSLTVAEVRGWKLRADASARELSSESQVAVWGKAVDALMNRSLA
ncbi:glycosyltransferase family 1 protein [Demequina sp. TTPB684]|uniref:glycosyltransferase family 1 protein n=1 Tax=unclassified Demequina TaxID=2620311 RepID=UPI001CF2C4F2|nr:MULTISPECIES: glycosyltransferase family 1 protein [unclassified Demequina]MCB2413612.1 glycosyltransferase family 1 protein [Demequina sp. TTPB684]UPU88264.1 glycosyltransferase family 1 protein [Demequina sp. TMPB413]